VPLPRGDAASSARPCPSDIKRLDLSRINSLVATALAGQHIKLASLAEILGAASPLSLPIQEVSASDEMNRALDRKSKAEEPTASTTSLLHAWELTRGETLDKFCVGPEGDMARRAWPSIYATRRAPPPVVKAGHIW
jgi:hypothetical protein